MSKPHFRKKETHEKYQNLIKNGYINDGCRLCKMDGLTSFKYWNITENDFPYDAIAKTHHMLCIKRHVDENQITNEEWRELKTIKNSKDLERYTFIFETLPHRKSIPNHFHLHLIEALDVI